MQKFEEVRKKRKQQGFTLMELLIVIIILGFLLGMIMPRLSSIVSGDAIDNVCDTNNKGMRQYTNMMLQRSGHLPNGMTNLVNCNASNITGTNAPLTIEDKDTSNGAEDLAAEFFERNAVGLVTLSEDEADQVKKELGISYVYNLNSDSANYDPMQKMTIQEGAPVAMVGIGNYRNPDNATEELPLTSNITSWGDTTTVYPKGNPYWAGRIVLGIGNKCELVTEGYIQAAALCPGGIQNADNVSFNNYCLILPRLEATADERQGDFGVTYDEDDEPVEYTFEDTKDSGATEVMVWEAQEAWQFDFTCPEGHKWPDNDNDDWKYKS
jgi:prepilin-type N-terminal cleavage/methylation domain-containing protein